MAHWSSDYEKPFTLVIQRKRIKSQVEVELDLDTADIGEHIVSQGYIYRCIATNQDDWSISTGITSEQKTARTGLKNLNAILVATHYLALILMPMPCTF